jgi:hypothetical protein
MTSRILSCPFNILTYCEKITQPEQVHDVICGRAFISAFYRLHHLINKELVENLSAIIMVVIIID